MEKNNENLFYVEIEDSGDVRRNIFESLKDIVENLKRFEKFKEIRKEKMYNINKLQVSIKGLNKHISSLKIALPESKLRALKFRSEDKEEKKVRPVKRKKIKKEEEVVEEKKPVSELEKLENELGAIEDKLSSLR